MFLAKCAVIIRRIFDICWCVDNDLNEKKFLYLILNAILEQCDLVKIVSIIEITKLLCSWENMYMINENNVD
jgi:hypothetical protein